MSFDSGGLYRFWHAALVRRFATTAVSRAANAPEGHSNRSMRLHCALR
jgi:hypothetical protein